MKTSYHLHYKDDDKIRHEKFPAEEVLRLQTPSQNRGLTIITGARGKNVRWRSPAEKIWN